MFERERIKYLEKPVTADEKAIAALLEKIARAITTKDVDLLVSAYSDVASIEVLTSGGALINKNEYRERMSKFISNIQNFALHNTVIRVNEQEAVVSCITVVSLQGKAFPLKNQRYLKCAKEGEKWRIVEAKYI